MSTVSNRRRGDNKKSPTNDNVPFGKTLANSSSTPAKHSNKKNNDKNKINIERKIKIKQNKRKTASKPPAKFSPQLEAILRTFDVLTLQGNKTPVQQIVSQAYSHADRELIQTFADYFRGSNKSTVENIIQYSVKLNDIQALTVGTQTPASQVIGAKFYMMNPIVTVTNTPVLVAYGLPAFQGSPDLSDETATAQTGVTVATRSTVVMPSSNQAWQLIGEWNSNTLHENTALLMKKTVNLQSYLVLGTLGTYSVESGDSKEDGYEFKVEYKVRQAYPNCVNRFTDIYYGDQQNAFCEPITTEAPDSTPHLVTAAAVTRID